MIIDLEEKEYNDLVSDVLEICETYDQKVDSLVQSFANGKVPAYTCSKKLRNIHYKINDLFNEAIRKHCNVQYITPTVKNELLEELPELCDSVVEARKGKIGSLLSQDKKGRVFFSFMDLTDPSPEELLKVFKGSSDFDAEEESHFKHDEKTIEAYKSESADFPYYVKEDKTVNFLDSYMKTWNREEYDKILVENLENNSYPNLIHHPLPERIFEDFLYAAKNHPKEFAEFLMVNPINRFWYEHKNELNKKTYDEIVKKTATKEGLSGLYKLELKYLQETHPEIYLPLEELEFYDEISSLIQKYPTFYDKISRQLPEKFAAYKKIQLQTLSKKPEYFTPLTRGGFRCLKDFQPEFLDSYLLDIFKKTQKNKKFSIDINSVEASYMKENHSDVCENYFVDKYVHLIHKKGVENVDLPELRAFSNEICAEALLSYYKDEAETDKFPSIPKTAFDCLYEFKKEDFNKFLCDKFQRLTELGKKAPVLEHEDEYMKENFPEIYQAYKERLSKNSSSAMMRYYNGWKPKLQNLSQVFCEIDPNTRTYKNSVLNFFALSPFKKPDEAREILDTMMQISKRIDDFEAFDDYLRLYKALPRRFTNFDWHKENAKQAYGGTTYGFLKDGKMIEVPFDDELCKVADKFLRKNHIPPCRSAYKEIMRPLARGELDKVLFTPKPDNAYLDELAETAKLDGISEIKADLTAEKMSENATKATPPQTQPKTNEKK